VLKIPRHDDWDVSEAYQRIDGVVPLESSCLVPLCGTVDHVIVGGKGTSTFYDEFLGRVCVCGGVGSERDQRHSGWRSK
jgi:hypothetical protein